MILIAAVCSDVLHLTGGVLIYAGDVISDYVRRQREPRTGDAGRY